MALLLAGSTVEAQSPVADRGAPGSLKNALVLHVNDVSGTGGLGPTVAALASLEIATLPLATSIGGLTFAFDPGARAVSTTRWHARVGVNWSHSTFDSIAGLDLHDGALQPIKNVRLDPGAPQINDFTGSTLTLNLSADTVVGFGSVAVTRDLEVGVAVPWVRVALDSTSTLHVVPGSAMPERVRTLSPRSEAGIGDIALFAGYRMLRHGNGGLALALDLRLPTGSTDSLRGLGVTRTLTSAVWSLGGTVSPHAAIGYELWSDGIQLTNTGNNNPSGFDFVEAKNQLEYAVGIEASGARVTATIDLVGRRLGDGGRLAYRTVRGFNRNLDLLGAASGAGAHAVSLAPAVKWRAWRDVLITAEVLASLSNDGLRAKVTPAAGVNWAF